MIIMGCLSPSNVGQPDEIDFYFGLVPILVWKKYFLWQLFTYIFLHGGFSHILFNLLALWMFGGELESYWGSKKFLFYFFFCGIGAGICHCSLSPYQFIPVIGASGAIYGILLAFGWLFPNRLDLTSISSSPSLLNTWSSFSASSNSFLPVEGTGGGIAHLTHLGGLLFGFFYMAYPMIRQKIRREYYKRKWSQRGPGWWGLLSLRSIQCTGS